MNENSQNHEKGSSCPGHEHLSSYFDNELDRSSPEFIHISSCKDCMMRIDDFEKLGDIINKNSAEQCHPALAEGILKKVRMKISDEKNTTIPFYLAQLLKIAAVVVVVFGVFAYIHSMSGDKPLISSTTGLKTAPAFSTISSEPSIPQNSKGISSKKIFMPENEIQFSNMSNVSTGQGTDFRNLPQKNGEAKVLPASIPENVNHVWTVKNLKDASVEVNDCIAKLGIPAVGISVSKEDGDMLQYSMNLTKKQISAFVKLFASAGNNLVSPVAPQPEQNLFYGNANDPVGYEMRLVPKGR